MSQWVSRHSARTTRSGSPTTPSGSGSESPEAVPSTPSVVRALKFSSHSRPVAFTKVESRARPAPYPDPRTPSSSTSSLSSSSSSGSSGGKYHVIVDQVELDRVLFENRSLHRRMEKDTRKIKALEKKLKMLERTVGEHSTIAEKRDPDLQSGFTDSLLRMFSAKPKPSETVLVVRGYVSDFAVLERIDNWIVNKMRELGYGVKFIDRFDVHKIKVGAPLLMYLDTFIYGGNESSSIENHIDRVRCIGAARDREIYAIEVVVTTASDLEKNGGALPRQPGTGNERANHVAQLLCNKSVTLDSAHVELDSYREFFGYLQEHLRFVEHTRPVERL